MVVAGAASGVVVVSASVVVVGASVVVVGASVVVVGDGVVVVALLVLVAADLMNETAPSAAMVLVQPVLTWLQKPPCLALNTTLLQAASASHEARHDDRSATEPLEPDKYFSPWPKSHVLSYPAASENAETRGSKTTAMAPSTGQTCRQIPQSMQVWKSIQ